MQLKLSENIKKYRKDMSLTQEALAEVLGVTVGAVSKWENGNNVPDVLMMMEIANLFNISVDELLGFSLSSKKIEDMCNEIETLVINHSFDEAILKAKDVMMRYPHTFKVLYTCGDLYYYKFLESNKKADSMEGIRLFEEALNYITQSSEQEMKEYAIKTKMAYLYRKIDPEKAIDLLQKTNYDEWRCNEIGMVLLDMGKIDEALENFSISLLKSFTEHITTVNNMTEALLEKGKTKDLETAQDLVETELKIVDDFCITGKVNVTYKLKALLYTLMVFIQAYMNNEDKMEEYMNKAYELAAAFDKSDIKKDYFSGFKYVYFNKEDVKVFDASGTNAADSIKIMIDKKLEETKGKNKEKIKKVLNYWESLNNKG